MFLINASTRWSHVCLLFTRNIAFARLHTQIIRLRAQLYDCPIQFIWMNNAGEFTSQAFYDYYMSIGINVEHPVAYTQNGLTESFIKRLQLIAQPLLMKTKLLIFAWGYTILHTASLVQIKPATYQKYSHLHLAIGQPPNIYHFYIFDCVVYVLIALPQRTKMEPQHKLGIYVDFDSPSIIRYLEPLTGDILKACFENCHFDENIFTSPGKEKSLLEA
jgi:hypothetical protein